MTRLPSLSFVSPTHASSGSRHYGPEGSRTALPRALGASSCPCLAAVAPISTKNFTRGDSKHHSISRSHFRDTLSRANSDAWFMKIVLIVWLVSSIFVVYAFTRIDSIVNHDLYNFGLTFSHVWADPYWTFTRTAIVCISLPATLSLFVLFRDVWRRMISKKSAPSSQPTDRFAPITCPSCKKRFSNSLTMYDYSTGRAELIKICPYCNTVLKDEHARDPTIFNSKTDQNRSETRSSLETSRKETKPT